MRLAPAKRGHARDIGVPIGLGHAVIEEDAEHPIAEAAQPVMNCRTITLGLVSGLDHQCRAMPVENGPRAVEDLPLVPLDIDLYQVEPVEPVLCDERIEATHRHMEN